MPKKRGKCPSLIGTTHGSSRVEEAKRIVSCKRCASQVTSGFRYLSVSVPGSMGRRSYCVTCFADILAQSRKDIDALDCKIKVLAARNG